MKKLAYALLLLPVIVSCNSSSNNSEKNIALIEKYVRSVEDLDYLTMESLLDDNYFGYGPSYGDSIGKAQAVEYWKDNVTNLYESIKYNRSRNVAVTITTGENQGDWVSNWGELHIVYKNGKGEVTLWANTTYEIDNGKIVKSYTFYNEADALNQLGYVFINPSDL
ncbi:MAG: hypothetical protein KAI99_10695 [Cyclobacteriaceae bacterium]|nr:hypothetical protein [Cyclobacteriaceae bacterium]